MKEYVRFIVIVISFSLMMSDLFSQNTGSQKVPTKSDIINKWKMIFSDSIDFSNQILFDGMVYIGPQSKEKMQPFKDKVLDRTVKSESSEWFKTFFYDSLFLAIDSIKPVYFYFPENQEASFLYYDFKYKGYKLNMYESFNGILLEIKTDSLIDFRKTPLKQLEVSNLLKKLINFRYKSNDEIIQGFSLPKTLKEGTVFKNTDKRIGVIRSWQDGIVGFITRNSICVLLFKAHEGRAQVGLTYDYEWLEKNLYAKDGKTPVKKQKN